MNYEGLKYKLNCTNCGKCCTNGTNSSSTFLYIDDIIRISKELGMEIVEFLENYTNVYCYKFQTPKEKEIETFRIVLKAKSQCIFLKDNLCSIHNFKPFICKHGPYLSNILNNQKEWDYWLNSCQGLILECTSGEEFHKRKKNFLQIKKTQDLKEKQYFDLTHFTEENNVFKYFISKSKKTRTFNLKI